MAQNQSDINAFYTTKASTLYVLISPWPESHGACTVNVTLTAPKAKSGATLAATLLGLGSAVPLHAGAAGVTLTLPALDRLGDSIDPSGLGVAITGVL